MQFYVTRAGGLPVKEAGQIIETLQQGTAKDGPFYNAWRYSDSQLQEWIQAEGGPWIEWVG